MCGISGLINKQSKKVDEAKLHQMNEAIKHRGPDGDGFYIQENIGFGHRRLSIIDLSEASHQPMFKGEELVITYNGEIYNYLEIKEELSHLGHKFDTTGDTEVILAAYQQWGFNCVERFNGMWAFAIHDKSKDIIFCSRDRFGIKPFYYYFTSEYFTFGSEIKQLLLFKEEKKVNQQVLLEYLITGLEECSTDTFFEDIKKLKAGHNLIYNLKDNTFDINPYYEIQSHKELNKLNELESVQKYYTELFAATKLRMRSDVKVGTCLSGGLDSSSVASISAKIYHENSTDKFMAIHAKSSELATDESDFAAKVANHCGIDLKVIEPSTADFASAVDEVIYTQEEPFGSPSVFMQYFVMKKAREVGCIVMLDGQGGDETLLGYEKYYPAFISNKKGLAKVKAFLSASKNSKLSTMDVLKYYIYFTRYSVRLKRVKKKLNFIKEEYLIGFESEMLKEISSNYLDIFELQKTEITKSQLPRLLRYEDKNSMKNSVESRLPLIDFNVLETALSIDNSFKIRDGWTKFVLRKAISPLLPEDVVWRKNKLGFNAPEKTWLDKIDSEMNETIQSSKILAEYTHLSNINLEVLDYRRKWRLFNIAKWEQLYEVSI
ncbi:MAG: asparagine synthase (glutamine-hydrolyzing) [Crocinitomicaceae bacterium]|nr:asparagine synthase (glutamine-hydrolyzing) [Crocinitomicaceae bacterium]